MGGRGSGARPSDFDPAPGIDPWERQPKETDKAFAAFATYRDLGAERSVAKLCETLGKKPIYRRVCEGWSSKWGWRIRTAAWDAYCDRREREVVLEEAEKKAREKLSVADGMWKTAAKGLLMWSRYLDHVQQQQQATGSVSTPPISPADVHRLADAGLKLSQLLEGKPTDISEQRKQITVEERRKGIQGLITNPRLRAAMRQVAEAMDGEPDAQGNGNGRAQPDAGGNGAAVH